MGFLTWLASRAHPTDGTWWEDREALARRLESALMRDPDRSAAYLAERFALPQSECRAPYTVFVGPWLWIECADDDGDIAPLSKMGDEEARQVVADLER